MLDLLKALPVLIIGAAVCISISGWLLVKLGMLPEDKYEPEDDPVGGDVAVKMVSVGGKATYEVFTNADPQTLIVAYNPSPVQFNYETHANLNYQAVSVFELMTQQEILTQQHGVLARYWKPKSQTSDNSNYFKLDRLAAVA
jgi:hypothetical protein